MSIQAMRSTARILLGGVLAVVLLAFAVIVEESVRSRYGGPMSIHGLPLNNARVTGTWKPDFLWTGRAWIIEFQSHEGLELSLDGRTYTIPKGSHTIYSNHDHTNTGLFGSQNFWGYPEMIEVRPLGQKP